MSTRDSGVTPNPNLIGPPKTKRGGLSEKARDPSYLSPDEAEFVAAKRQAGVSDEAIAKMLQTSVQRIRRNVVVSDSDQRPIWDCGPDFDPPPTVEERQRRRNEAAQTRVWRATKD